MTSILLPWVEKLGLRHQGVLMSSLRGCDLAPRHDPSKLIQRLLRAAILIPHGGRMANPKTYITNEPDHSKWWETALPFLRSWDHYPNHYVVHFVHATEVIGYLGPVEGPVYSDRWAEFYQRACHTLHVNPETREQLNARLDADEKTFHEAQDSR